RPEIVMQMVVTKYTEGQIDSYKKFREELGADRILFKGYFYEFTNLGDEAGSALAPTDGGLAFGKEKKKVSIEKKKSLCGWPYRSVAIMSNGNLTPCCIDFDGTLLKGLRLDNGAIGKVWNSKRYRKFRKAMVSGKIDLCNKCFMS
ncbi:MAG: SPASM domain-containing protein, partial [Candidatus Omnitrophica bacterium]|nr:SPASM domain-containing protein [Candidatus Omnitrophota bacterium]